MTMKTFSSRKKGLDIIDAEVLIERLKKARALNRGFDSIGLTQYKWRSFLITRERAAGKF